MGDALNLQRTQTGPRRSPADGRVLWRRLAGRAPRKLARVVREVAAKDMPPGLALDAMERRLHGEGLALICGVDEAGRGPLAGPVTVGAVMLRPDDRIEGLNDSKLLGARERERLALEIRRRALAWSVVSLGPEEIDRLNILWASLEGMRRAVEALSLSPQRVLADGNRLPRNVDSALWSAQVKGDGRISAVAAASILAKVQRDAVMRALDAEFPGYGFAKHKGYPTLQHRRALSKLGPSPVHRRSFRLHYED